MGPSMGITNNLTRAVPYDRYKSEYCQTTSLAAIARKKP